MMSTIWTAWTVAILIWAVALCHQTTQLPYFGRAKENTNLAAGVKDALSICLNEMLDYIGDITDDEEDDYYSDYDKETARLVRIIKSELDSLAKISV